ncbi:inovirus Gp2 family protein [Acinetobacter sp. ANC 4633]|uniref:YagK/YfjJ domain-containing protein n=1 Tax=Acinetobacter sp. ANC 4633 TaxID=2529845 RepID=UPI0010407B6A|nr:inovirus-type Gp2 protein [Acinetobacter sp. ANC 4633]TCB27133.1 inovirus Gp2 family protein [Acinetobacter sp. ANC 4633]
MSTIEIDLTPNLKDISRFELIDASLPSEELEQSVEVENEESLSAPYDEVSTGIELEHAYSDDADNSAEVRNLLTTNLLCKQQLDPQIVACLYAILICNQIKKHHATYLYGWIKSKQNQLVPDHWELIYPELLELIRSFLLANKQLKSPMHLKCEEYDLVAFSFNHVLPNDQNCLFDLIKYPNDQLNVINANRIPTGHKNSVAIIANSLVKEIFKGLKDEKFVQRVNDRRKMARKRKKNVLRYIDKLRKKYSRLVGVRIDLYLPMDKKHFTPKETVKHFHIILQKLRRSKTLHLKGYVTKLEYGIDQALHFHCFFFFCGSEHREDISLGRMIGEMWDKQIDGKHSYFNCNSSKNRKKYKYDALGVINRDDQTKYDNIAKVIHYFAKFEQYVLHSSLERVKTLNTGVSPHLRNKMGRPNLTKHY